MRVKYYEAIGNGLAYWCWIEIPVYFTNQYMNWFQNQKQTVYGAYYSWVQLKHLIYFDHVTESASRERLRKDQAINNLSIEFAQSKKC